MEAKYAHTDGDALDSNEEMFALFAKIGLSKNREVDSNSIEVQKMFQKFEKEILKTWNPPDYQDEYRPEYANDKYGGVEFRNKEVTALIRSTGWDLIKQIGKKLISGDFNLTQISIPIKVMVPLTILQTIANSMFTYPLYFGLASRSKSPVEKMKFVIVSTLSPYHRSSHFLKPMNPILGETYELAWQDGSRIYLEQTSHHPPVSNYIMYGPNNSYKFHGFSNFSSSAGLNSLTVKNKGKRIIEFPDGTVIEYSFCYESYSNTFWGVFRHESLGDIAYKDLTNGYECIVKFGSVKKKPSDFIAAEIKLDDQVISKMYGSYLSHIEFDGKRYWDLRENPTMEAFEIANQPKSSSLFREDRVCLEKCRLEVGQSEKERLEHLQRHDRKLREHNNKSHKHY